MQTVLVAGGAGFIGSNLCADLLSKNYQVIAIDNFLTSGEENLIELKKNPHFSFINHDIIKLGEIADTLPHVDFIFHLASPASPNVKSKRSYMSFPLETLLVNSVGTQKLLELAKKNSARFLYASTSEVYGDPEITPQPEEYRGRVSSVGPRSVYDEGKRFGEAMVMCYVRKYGVDARIMRIFNTYGPQMQVDDGRVVSNFINQAIHNEAITIYGDGSQTRSFCYVSDLIEGMQRLLFTDGLTGEVVNLGNPTEKSINEFATLVKELTGAASEIVHEDLPVDDPMQRRPDITKAKKLLNWEPTVSLEEGLKKTIEYFNHI